MYFDIYYFILVLPAMLLAMYAQSRVTSSYQRYSKVRTYSGQTGAQVARRILDDHGLQSIRIEQTGGNLTDHYDPREGVIRLSAGVYGSSSLSAVGIAAHETGHAVQHAKNYAPLTLRNTIIPVTNFGSKLSIPLILFGLIVGSQQLLNYGILCFSLMAVFQLITLPVEFDASHRAITLLTDTGVLQSHEEIEGTKKVLSAAALTYVAALFVSIAQILRLILLFGGRNRD